MNRRKVLYLQHPYGLGGSCVSLLYLLQQLDQTRYEPVIGCLYNAPVVIDFYRSRGFQTVVVGGEMFSHTTGGWWPVTNPLGLLRLVKWLVQFPAAVSRLRAIIKQISPNLVHLNSLTLAPYAPFVKQLNLPLVLHVRESVHPGHFGFRRAFLKYLVSKWCDEVIYICQDDRRRLTGNEKGVVIYNFVDFKRFSRDLDRAEARSHLELKSTDKVVLYLGGVNEIKGIVPLLQALPQVKSQVPHLTCLMPGAQFPKPKNPVGRILRKIFSLVGWRSSANDQAKKLYDQSNINTYMRLMEFRQDVPLLIAASDVIVFPSLEPHFARPVMEAAAMGKPVVASAIGGVKEIVEDSVMGLLVEPGNVKELVEALIKILSDTEGTAENMGQAAYRKARLLFDARVNSQKTFAIYDRLLEELGNEN